MNADRYRLPALLIALGLLGGGWLLGREIAAVRLADRVVTVRGLAERDVTADLATWTFAYSATGQDVAAVQAEIDSDTAAIRTFLVARGFRPADLVPAGVAVNQWIDSNPAYGPGGRTNVTVRQRLQLRTGRVADVERAAAGLSDLVRAGVALEEGSNPVYSFTRLNALKPAMIEAATRDARKAAEQFAKDSDADLAGIKRASQGYFSIGSRDGDETGQGGGNAIDSPYKKVRVVTTVDFYLAD